MAVARAMAGSLAVGDEHARAQEALSGGLTLMAQAVVKMFRSDNGGGWQEVGGPGMLVYCANSSGVQWVKVVQLSDGAQLLNEELYEDFNRTYASDGRAAQMACHTETNQQRPSPNPNPNPNPNPHPNPDPNRPVGRCEMMKCEVATRFCQKPSSWKKSPSDGKDWTLPCMSCSG